MTLNSGDETEPALPILLRHRAASLIALSGCHFHATTSHFCIHLTLHSAPRTYHNATLTLHKATLTVPKATLTVPKATLTLHKATLTLHSAPLTFHKPALTCHKPALSLKNTSPFLMSLSLSQIRMSPSLQE